MNRLPCLAVLLMGGLAAPAQAPPDRLPGTAALTASTNVVAEMTAGIDQFLTRELERSVKERSKFWNRDFLHSPPTRNPSSRTASGCGE